MDARYVQSLLAAHQFQWYVFITVVQRRYGNAQQTNNHTEASNGIMAPEKLIVCEGRARSVRSTPEVPHGLSNVPTKIAQSQTIVPRLSAH